MKRSVAKGAQDSRRKCSAKQAPEPVDIASYVFRTRRPAHLRPFVSGDVDYLDGIAIRTREVTPHHYLYASQDEWPLGVGLSPHPWAEPPARAGPQADMIGDAALQEARHILKVVAAARRPHDGGLGWMDLMEHGHKGHAIG